MEDSQESREHQKRQWPNTGARRDTRSGKERLSSGGKNIGFNPFIYIGKVLFFFQICRAIDCLSLISYLIVTI